jgi:signal transduction histidine kinase
MVLLVLLLPAATAAAAVSARAEPTDWRMRVGDDPSWASPELDAAGWSPVDIRKPWGESALPEVAGVSWYRLETRVPEGDQPLGVALGEAQYSSYEVFAGGRSIGRFDQSPARPAVFEIPASAAGDDGSLVIAVRLWRDPAYARIARDTGGDATGLFAVGDAAALRDRVELERRRTLMGALPELVCTVLFALVGLYHLQLFSRRRQLAEYLWFGLLTLSATVNIFFFSPWVSETLTPFAAGIIGAVALHTATIAWIEFTWALFGWRVGRWARAFEAVHVFFAIMRIVAPELTIVDFGVWPFVAMAPLLLVWTVLIPRQALRGDPTARTLCFGLACLAAARGYQLLVMFALAPRVNIIHWAFAALILSMAIALSNRFGRVYARLDELNQDLEGQVAERTARLDETVAQLRASEQQAVGAREAALAASAAKSVFLANMSHELRTPLNAILGFVQLLKRNRALDAESHERLGVIMRSGEHLLGLINDILSISKIEAGRATLNPRPFDLRRALLGLDEIFRIRAASKGVTLDVEIAPSLPDAVLGDEDKLRQILINLLGNAIKFTDEGGVTLRATWSEGRATVEVEDTGPGIAHDELEAVFEPFAQTESGRATQEGTGLGLAISRDLAQLMGGSLTVSSAPGRGSIFRFEVALPEAIPVAVEDDAPMVVGLEPGQPVFRVLIADDVADNRTLLDALMRSVGFEVRQARHGREAVEIWTSWQPHLIWMDVRMPVMDGIEATREIRGREGVRSQESGIGEDRDWVCNGSDPASRLLTPDT